MLDELAHPGIPFGIPVNRDAWKNFDVERLLAATAGVKRTGRLRVLCEGVNRVRPSARLRPGEVITLALVHDVFRYVAEQHWREDHAGLLEQGLTAVDAAHRTEVVRPSTTQLARHFPIVAEPLAPREAGAEMALLSLVAFNPAAAPYRVLFGDERLRTESPYPTLVAGLEAFFARQPTVRGSDETLFDFLRAPILASPHSLAGQLEYILANWRNLLPKWLLDELLTAQGILREEDAQRGLGPGAIDVLVFGEGRDPEPERFTPDRDWMANVVLMAKSTYVWLDQLSKKHQRHIHRVDQIPDEELDRLARWGFTGLWLIGIWERSQASEEIKRRMGNPEAVASAYSLYDYAVAGDLGGQEAYADLARRAWERGIRLAADMVPNHVGIHSKWVIEHPDWFLQLDHPPYPSYSFTGPDLSRTPGVGIRIEDGYWNHSDAAVVFERIDYNTGQRRYIYHGNDGTSMPWNDTAQLDYLNPEVREAVINTILHVARLSPIIRFDAAMTLANRHIQRLWYPPPGEGGAVPSRAERGMSRGDFAAAMPSEFWRDVVDRVQTDQSDTLLLAEAFWLMEGYFVRTLGMHRVYNSAFMNMLKMEDNAKYRQTIKNVLEYSPQILKRFVNFMSNPDERTAVEQFGDGDKYFGCALLLMTMPGLPMVAHGQIEGFKERYGMEYRRAYWDEHVNDALVARHEQDIFPLMRRRYLFSQVDNFALYDFVCNDGAVDENVFAYSNAAFGERALVIYNNAYNDTAGWVHTSSAINVGSVESPNLVRRSLAEALSLRIDDGTWYVFRDHETRLEYLRHSRELSGGLFVSLGAYGSHVFVDWREIADADASWVALAHRLGGRGVPSIDDARRDLELEPVTHAFESFVRAVVADEKAKESDAEPATVQGASNAAVEAAAEAEADAKAKSEVETGPAPEAALVSFLEVAAVDSPEAISEVLAAALEARSRLEGLSERAAELYRVPRAGVLVPVLAVLRALPEGAPRDLRLTRVVGRVLDDGDLSDLLLLLLEEQEDAELVTAAGGFLLVNRYEGVDWFNEERMVALRRGQTLSRLVGLAVNSSASAEAIDATVEAVERLRQAISRSACRLADLMQVLKPATTTKPADGPSTS